MIDEEKRMKKGKVYLIGACPGFFVLPIKMQNTSM